MISMLRVCVCKGRKEREREEEKLNKSVERNNFK